MNRDKVTLEMLHPLPREAGRDWNESSFTPHLRMLLGSQDHVLMVAFVDQEGECIDYCSTFDFDETKIMAAHAHVIFKNTEQALKCGGVSELFVRTNLREIRVYPSLGHTFLVVCSLPDVNPLLVGNISFLGHALDLEMESISSTMRPRKPGEVFVYCAKGQQWEFSPVCYYSESQLIWIQKVLGKEENADEVFFQVRLQGDEEKTLRFIHDVQTWSVL